MTRLNGFLGKFYLVLMTINDLDEEKKTVSFILDLTVFQGS